MIAASPAQMRWCQTCLVASTEPACWNCNQKYTANIGWRKPTVSLTPWTNGTAR